MNDRDRARKMRQDRTEYRAKRQAAMGEMTNKEMDMRKLWRFDWNRGRQGSLEGIFVATQEEVDRAVGQDLYFGEVLGKHSEVYGRLESEEVAPLDVPPEDLPVLLRHADLITSGFDPLTALRCPECEGIVGERLLPSGVCRYCQEDGGGGN